VIGSEEVSEMTYFVSSGT